MPLVKLPGLRGTIEQISQRNNLPQSAVEDALKEALLKGYERYRRSQSLDRQHFEEEYFDNFSVNLDTEEEGFMIVAAKEIVEEVANEDHQISLAQVKSFYELDEESEESQDLEEIDSYLGKCVTVDVTPDREEFGRMAAIQTKQVLLQKLRDRQRQMIQEEFQELENQVLIARVLRFERQSAIMAVSSSLGQPEVEAELPKKEQLPQDTYRSNATFKVYLKRVKEGPQRGSQLIVSRASAGLVVELFANEVPEIEEEIVRIVAVAREANPPSRYVGPRTKIAVDTLEKDVDPVGACIGARGSRIQAVVNELRGEKIDVIRWSPDPASYIANSLSPARVDRVILYNAEERQSLVLVAEDQLSLAIGKEGQNVRLAARLTGWKIDIKNIDKFDPEVDLPKLIAERTATSNSPLKAKDAREEDEDFAAEEE
jgi:transcription termination/antitermination protein NusA